MQLSFCYSLRSELGKNILTFSTYRQHPSGFQKGSNKVRSLCVILNTYNIAVGFIIVPGGQEDLVSENLKNCCH